MRHRGNKRELNKCVPSAPPPPWVTVQHRSLEEGLWCLQAFRCQDRSLEWWGTNRAGKLGCAESWSQGDVGHVDRRRQAQENMGGSPVRRDPGTLSSCTSPRAVGPWDLRVCASSASIPRRLPYHFTSSVFPPLLLPIIDEFKGEET